MKILITSGMSRGHLAFGNMGDVAQLQSGLARLAHLWPSAVLNVLTETPEDLVRFCPQAIPIPASGRNLWVGDDLLVGRLARLLPARGRHVALRLKRKAATRFPAVLKSCLNARLRLQGRLAAVSAVSSFIETITTTDLVVASGAGGFFDRGRDWNMETLDTIEAAVERNIPVVMIGQHFGPLTDPELLSRMRRILPAVALITLRGNPGARLLLESLGVSSSRIQVTGDEAIEIAYEARQPKCGRHLGVNFRLGGSSETNTKEIEMLRPILQRFAKMHSVRLIPAPISLESYTADHLATKQLLQGFDDQSNGGAHLDSPLRVIEQIGFCKVLVTCAYHAAVFALAQGIPVVGVAKSGYFVEKFLGLKAQFGAGCELVLFDRVNDSNDLFQAIERAWRTSEDLRAPLLQAAVRQLESIRNAYSQIKKLVATRTCTT